MRRRILQLLLAAMVAALPLVAGVAPARADNAGTLLGLVNSLRRVHGAAPLSYDANLTATAQQWSAHMAAAGVLSHNPSYGSGVAPGWTKLGENVGEGGDLMAIFNALVASPFHFANMVDPSFNLTGIAVAVGSGNTLWVTEDFEARPGATPVITAPPTPPATHTPAPPVNTTRPATTAPPAHPAATTTAPIVAPTTAAPTTAASTAAPPPADTTTTSGPPGAGRDRVTSGSGSATTPVVAPQRNASGSTKLAAVAPFSPLTTGGALLFLVLSLVGLAAVSTARAVYSARKRR